MAIPPRPPTAKELAWYYKQQQREVDDKQAFKERIKGDGSENLRQYFPELDQRLQDLAIDHLADSMVRERVSRVDLLERSKAEISNARARAQDFDREQRENQEGPYALNVEPSIDKPDRPEVSAQDPELEPSSRSDSLHGDKPIEVDDGERFYPHFPDHDGMSEADREFWREKLGGRLATGHYVEIKEYYKGRSPESREEITARHTAEWDQFEKQFGAAIKTRPLTSRERVEIEASLKEEALAELEAELRAQLEEVISARVTGSEKANIGETDRSQRDPELEGSQPAPSSNDELFEKLDEVFRSGAASSTPRDGRGPASPAATVPETELPQGTQHTMEAEEGRGDPPEAAQPRRRGGDYDELKEVHAAAAKDRGREKVEESHEQSDRVADDSKPGEASRKKLSFFEDRAGPSRSADAIEQGGEERRKLNFFEDRRPPGNDGIQR